MSRGLGANQRLVLRALVALDQDSETTGRSWKIYAVLNKMHDLELGKRESDRDEAYKRRHAAEMADLTARAAEGDQQAKLMLGYERQMEGIDQLLRRGRHHSGRPKVRKGRTIEDFNPTRVLDLLERRGLVERYKVPGLYGARLTPSGFTAAMQIIASTINPQDEAA